MEYKMILPGPYFALFLQDAYSLNIGFFKLFLKVIIIFKINKIGKF